LLIKIREITDGGLELALPLGRDLLRDALVGLDGDLDRSHADAKLSVTKSDDDDVFISGKITGEVMVPCVRCLTEVKTKVEVPLRMVFTPVGEEADEKDDSDVEHGTHDGHQIDLGETLREALILSVPMNPICSPTCKGLCPVCGGDRNKTSCGCQVATLEDPRLAPLKGLKL
jgi:uncharacterized protein